MYTLYIKYDVVQSYIVITTSIIFIIAHVWINNVHCNISILANLTKNDMMSSLAIYLYLNRTPHNACSIIFP